MMYFPRNAVLGPLVLMLGLGMFPGCKEETGALAPYTDPPTRLSKIIVQEGSFTPSVKWVGGYTSVIGINLGERVALDSTLVWLVYTSGDNLQYPVRVGEIPSGAQDLTASYGGVTRSRLIEDSTYAFWVMKEDAWTALNQLPGPRGKPIVVDSAAATLVRMRNDTIVVSAASFVSLSRRVDVYINIGDFRAFGRLAEISVTETDTSHRPVVSWQLRTPGGDSLISAIGIVRSQEYDVANVQWEMISRITQPDTTYYWIHNVIRSPLLMGDHFANTVTFTEYPAGGLERGYVYMIWIANKDWNREGRVRSTPNYAYATFIVW